MASRFSLLIASAIFGAGCMGGPTATQSDPTGGGGGGGGGGGSALKEKKERNKQSWQNWDDDDG